MNPNSMIPKGFPMDTSKRTMNSSIFLSLHGFALWTRLTPDLNHKLVVTTYTLLVDDLTENNEIVTAPIKSKMFYRKKKRDY